MVSDEGGRQRLSGLLGEGTRRRRQQAITDARSRAKPQRALAAPVATAPSFAR